MKRKGPSPALLRRAKAVRIVITDVDGVLTDGGITIDERGIESRRFHVSDGSGVVYLRRAGIPTAFVSGRKSLVVEYRAREIGVEHVLQGVRDKDLAVEEILRRLDLGPREACFLGDDLLDLPALGLVGLPAAVANACPEVKAAAAYVTTRAGGTGAFREVAEMILAAQGRWAEVVEAAGRPPGQAGRG